MHYSLTPHLCGPRVSAAVFLDRDGTLIEDRGWLRDPADVVFFEDIFEPLRALQKVVRLFIVTNQSGISKGLLTASQADTVNRHVVERLEREGIRIDAVYTCPHQRDEGCSCIKPNPWFAWQAAAEFQIAPGYSFAIGDHPHDVEFAARFGGTGLYVLSGHGEKHRDELSNQPEVPVCSGLAEAIGLILQLLQPLPDVYIGAGAAAQILKSGGVVAIPTETVYGMAANALDEAAVERVFQIKGRPSLDPLIVHIADAASLDLVAAAVPPVARTLAAAFWPGPLTLVLPKKACIPGCVTAGLDTVAVRVPSHPVARQILRRTGCPLAAPSANCFGGISPTCARHVLDSFETELDGIVDGGHCSIGVESTIIGFWDNRLWLLRPGGIPLEVIESVAGPVEFYHKKTSSDVRAPGSLSRHYAPATPLVLLGQADPFPPHSRAGLLVFGPEAPARGDHLENISPSGNFSEAAANLYAAMRRLDAAGLDVIYARRFPDAGLGRTLNDRLSRAAAVQTSPEEDSADGK